MLFGTVTCLLEFVTWPVLPTQTGHQSSEGHREGSPAPGPPRAPAAGGLGGRPVFRLGFLTCGPGPAAADTAPAPTALAPTAPASRVRPGGRVAGAR